MRFGEAVLGELFVGRVLRDGKVTIPKRIRELVGVVEGDYVRLELVGVVKAKVARRGRGRVGRGRGRV
ncbi:hypothetical protein [Candidatus Hecatella orcuttiae]|uniref:hypothetical protein n=1 Tax=Candidatus Hecatella orcuttiae TaxID=1935119 RepID=UPI00286817FB|nr:hypothetical protein [Candidatus Hecatella orcuttiae]